MWPVSGDGSQGCCPWSVDHEAAIRVPLQTQNGVVKDNCCSLTYDNKRRPKKGVLRATHEHRVACLCQCDAFLLILENRRLMEGLSLPRPIRTRDDSVMRRLTKGPASRRLVMWATYNSFAE